MQRVNGHRFYDLAVKIQPLLVIEASTEIKAVFFQLWDAREAILSIFIHVPLRVCIPPAQKIVDAIDSVIPRDWNEATKSLSSDTHVGFAVWALRQGAREFETVLEAELQSLDTYLVSQKGAYSTPDLIDRAEFIFPESIRKHLPEQAINDVRQAGRCLALDTPTACAFHVLRAVESAMSVYFEVVIGKPMPTRMRNWGIYLKALRKHPDHSPKVVNLLDHIRDSYRNPILHPDVIVSEDEAEALLGTAASAIRLLVLETLAVKDKAKSLRLDLPQALPPAVA